MSNFDNNLFDSDSNRSLKINNINKDNTNTKSIISSDYEIHSNIFDSKNSNYSNYKLENELILGLANEQEKFIKKFSIKILNLTLKKVFVKNKIKYFKDFLFLSIYKNKIKKNYNYNKGFNKIKKLLDKNLVILFDKKKNKLKNKSNLKIKRISKLLPPSFLKRKRISKLQPPSILNAKRFSQLPPPLFLKGKRMSLLPPPLFLKGKRISLLPPPLFLKGKRISQLPPPLFNSIKRFSTDDNINNKKILRPKFLPPPNLNLKMNKNKIVKEDPDDPIPEEPEKLKKIFISKLTGTFLQKSFWIKYKKELIEKNKLILIDFKSIELEFKKMKNKNKNEEETKLKKESKKKFILDHKREYMISIALNRLKIDKHYLISILDLYNFEEISFDYLDILTKLLPNKEEEEILLKNKNNYSNLQENDQFLIDLISINRYKQKINCMNAMKKFEEEYNRNYEQIEELYEILFSIKNDFNFKLFLKTMLRIVNFINYDSKHGECKGIILKYYRNLKNIYSLKSRISIFEIAIKYIYESNEKLLNFIDNYLIINNLKIKRSFFDLYLKTLQDYLSKVKNEEEFNKNLFNKLDNKEELNKLNIFLDKSKIFITDSEFKISNYKNKILECDNIFKEILINFGFKKNWEIEEFLSIFSDIINDIQINYNKYIAKIEEIKNEKEKELKKNIVKVIKNKKDKKSVEKMSLLKSSIIDNLKNKVEKFKKKKKTGEINKKEVSKAVNKNNQINNKGIIVKKDIEIDNKGFICFD